MALMTVTNTTYAPQRTLNRPATYYGPDFYGVEQVPDPLLGSAILVAKSSGLYNDLKGHKLDPLPYPLDRVGELAFGDSVIVAVHGADFTHKAWWDSHTPANLLNQMVQEGDIAVSFAAEAGNGDVYDAFAASL